MKAAVIGSSLVVVAIFLHGCGGGGGGGDPTPAPSGPTPAPATVTTTTTTTAPPYGAEKIRVVNYNLFWWCVSGNPKHNPENHGENCAQYTGGRGWQMLYDVIKERMPFDFLGLSECENSDQILNGLGLASTFQAYLAPPQNWGVSDSGFLWNKTTWEQLEDPSADLMSHDQYGDRWLGKVRLKHKRTGQTVLFGNTHGGLGKCGTPAGQDVYKAFTASIAKTRKDTDSVIVTGDFNCRPEDEQMRLINSKFTAFHDQGPMLYDNIVRSNWVRLDDSYSKWQKPSDHAIISNDLSLPNWADGKAVPDPPPAPGPPGPGPPTPPPPVGPTSKCADIGCGNHDATCWCAATCVSHNSCCDDWKTFCPQQEVATKEEVV